MKEDLMEKREIQTDSGDDNKVISPMRSIHMIPMDKISGFEVRPGIYEVNGATAIPCGVNFTVHSYHATGCELLLFRRMEDGVQTCALPICSHSFSGKLQDRESIFHDRLWIEYRRF